jgi:hypothetical protein
VFLSRRFFALGLQLIVVLFFSSQLAAQSSRASGTLMGTVRDSSGAGITQASITATNTDNHQQRTALSDDGGSFVVSNMPDGTYGVRVHKDGFADAVYTSVSIAVGSIAQLDIHLQPASATEEVTVSASGLILEPQQTSVATVIDKERIEELPVQSRNYLNFILLAPGVAPANANLSQNSPALAGSGFSFGGLRPRSNALYIDGTDNNDEFTGATRTEISLEDVQEFQVVNHGFAAESGGAAGGSTDVVTRAGANAIHGDAFIFVQNGATDAKPPFEFAPRKSDLNRERVGLSIGGPIRTDRTFYYSSFEQEHARGEEASDLQPQTVQAINTALATTGPLNTFTLTSGFFPTGREETEFSQRFDHQLGAQNSLMLRYAFTNNREIANAFHTNDFVDASGRGSSFTLDHALIGAFTTILSAHSVNDLRFQIAARRVLLKTNQHDGPGIEIPGLVEFGRPFSGNGIRHENRYEIGDAYSFQRGAHLYKAGFSFNRVHERASLEDGFGGLYVFATLQHLQSGAAAFYDQAFGDRNTNFPVDRIAGFAQDHWSATQKLTVDYGLRYDFAHLPRPFNQDTNNISPRIGAAWAVARDWVIRSGLGLFYDRYPLAELNNVLQKNGIQSFEQIAEGDTAAALYRAGVRYGASIPGIQPSINTAQPNLANAYSGVATLGLEHSITENLSVGATYSYVRGIKLARTANVNLLPPTLLTASNAGALGVPNPTPQQIGRYVFSPQRVNPAFDHVDQLQSTAGSTYNGLTLTLNRRMAQEFELLASYTYSKVSDDASDFVEQPQNPFQPHAERAVSLNDQRQRFVLSALWDLPIGDVDDPKDAAPSNNPLIKALSNIEVAPILSIGSGQPANPLTGTDSSVAHTFSARPLGYGRNSLLAPASVNLDLRVLKTVTIGRGKLDIVAESFNLLNHVNVTALNHYFGNQAAPLSSFGKPTQVNIPRQFQFSLDYEF